MNIINIKTIKDAVYTLCLSANYAISKNAYSKLLSSYEKTANTKQKELLKNILLNAKIAYETKRPLCQDTGQVLVFMEIGQDVHIEGGDLKTAINEAVEECYKENFFRKSVVNNALFDRTNTASNTPAIIYTDIVKGEEIKINILIKGAGSENKSSAFMALPTADREEIKNLIIQSILSAGTNSCPPMFIGIGIGQTLDGAVLLSKKALYMGNQTKEEQDFSNEILLELNAKAPENYKEIYALDLKILSSSTHIASMPIGITLNCHSFREKMCIIKKDTIIYDNEIPDFIDFNTEDNHKKEILTENINEIRSLKEGENVLLTGEIFVARDAAHKKLFELLKENKPLPVEIKDNIIFYAGPCPANKQEVIGPIGPTTSGRMDKYAIDLYNSGLIATIGKGNRSKELQECIRKNRGIYFSVQGGIASLLKTCIKKSEIIAFSELGAEALYKLNIEKLPVTVEISANL